MADPTQPEEDLPGTLGTTSMNLFWRDRPTLVTGGEGFVGHPLIERLLESSADVVCLAHDDAGSDALPARRLSEHCRRVAGDVRDRSFVAGVLEANAIETVFHLAAQTGVSAAHRQPTATFETNIAGTWSVLEACRHSSTVRQIVLVSSERAYASGVESTIDEGVTLAGRHPLDVSRSCADLIARSYAETYDLPVAIARFGNFFGPGDVNWNRIVPGVIRAALEGRRPVLRSDALAARDYLYVDEGVAACMLLAEQLGSRRELRGQAFNFSYERRQSVLSLVNEILRLMHSDLEPLVLKTTRHEIRDQSLSAARARRVLAWRPVGSVEQALKQTIDWYRNYLEQGAWHTRTQVADLVAKAG